MNEDRKWQKCPSVTTGGKKHFWTVKIDGIMYHVVWDRGECRWAVQKNDVTLSYVVSDREGKKFVENFLL